MRSTTACAAAVLCAAVLLGGCSGSSDTAARIDPDTLTRRQKDSIVAGLPIRGAGAVGRALEASEAAAARARAHDTIR